MDNRYKLRQERSGLWRSLRDEDFEEGDVWAVITDKNDSFSPTMIGQSVETTSVSVKRNYLPTATRGIPRSSNASSNSNIHESKGVKLQQSAPVNIPDWSKIYGKKSNKSFSKNSRSWFDQEDDAVDDRNSDDDDEGNDEEEEDDDFLLKVPPHELLARRLARSQISSFSVFEGAGRTLKGRDLSKVRNAVLTKTGFLE